MNTTTTTTTATNVNVAYFLNMQNEAIAEYEASIADVKKKYDEFEQKVLAELVDNAKEVTKKKIKMGSLKEMWVDIEMKGLKKHYAVLKKLMEKSDSVNYNSRVKFEVFFNRKKSELDSKLHDIQKLLHYYMKENSDSNDVIEYRKSRDERFNAIKETYNDELRNIFKKTQFFKKVNLDMKNSEIWKMIENTSSRSCWGEVKRVREEYDAAVYEAQKFI